MVPEAERQMWAQQLGPTYKAFHHYCWGLIDMRRASATRSSTQAYHYRSAIGNFEYVQRNADASFPLLPELLLRKGMALRLLNRDSEAATEFTQAIRIKTDYTPAYAALVDLYVDLDDLEGARNILEQGLREAPESQILQNKKSELEGDGTETVR
jgi:tetratricopeptide (TPR) repeat protein